MRPVWNKKSVLENIFESILESTMNDPDIEDLIKSV